MFKNRCELLIIDAVAFTRGPGLLGSLLVGTSFSKALAMGLDIPLIEVNHMQAHVMSHFILNEDIEVPGFPFLCLTVSGGHTEIVLVKDYLKMEVVGCTKDDAVGEAFDKAAKILNLPYPGGPLIDKHARSGNAAAYNFPKPNIPNLDYSFSGLKTAFLYFPENLFYGEDISLSVKIAIEYPILIIDEIISIYYRHAQSSISKANCNISTTERYFQFYEKFALPYFMEKKEREPFKQAYYLSEKIAFKLIMKLIIVEGNLKFKNTLKNFQQNGLMLKKGVMLILFSVLPFNVANYLYHKLT